MSVEVATPVAQRYFEHCGIEQELDEALMEAFGATVVSPGDTDSETWPCSHMVYDDYDASFELWGVKDLAWMPTREQLEAAFALGFSRCWICYADGSEIYCSPTVIGERKPSHSDRTNEGKYLRSKLEAALRAGSQPVVMPAKVGP